MKRMWTAMVTGLVLLTGCASPSQPDADGSTTSQVDLNFTVATVDGGTFNVQTLAGKPALLWFWAPWCPTCAGQAPDVAQAAGQVGRKSRRRRCGRPGPSRPDAMVRLGVQSG